MIENKCKKYGKLNRQTKILKNQLIKVSNKINRKEIFQLRGNKTKLPYKAK